MSAVSLAPCTHTNRNFVGDVQGGTECTFSKFVDGTKVCRTAQLGASGIKDPGGHGDAARAGTALLWRQTGRAGAVQPGQEKAPVRLRAPSRA